VPALDNVPDTFQHVSAIAVVFAGLCVMYWRIVLRVAAIVIIVLITLGAALIIHGIQALAK
jgi:hypothetical protein